MNVYGLTLESCESLIWAIRQEPTLWNYSWGLDDGSKKGDGKCCVTGAYYRYHSGKNKKELVENLVIGKIKNGIVNFAQGWFYKIAPRLGCGIGAKCPSVNARNLTLGKLRKIRAYLLAKAEARKEASGWTPPIIETVPTRELAPSRGE